MTRSIVALSLAAGLCGVSVALRMPIAVAFTAAAFMRIFPWRIP